MKQELQSGPPAPHRTPITRPCPASCLALCLAVLSALAACLLGPAAVRADGFIVVHDGPVVPGHFSFAPLEVVYHHVTVDVSDQVATTAVDQEFYNPNGRQLEGTYLFPLPAGSHIDKFSMDVNGKMMEAELLPADKARAIYEDIVRRAKDPALLEYIGRDAFKVRIFPIEPNGRKHVKLSYTQLLKSESGMTEYAYPLNTEKFSSKPLKDVSVKINLTTREPLKNVYCPSHNCEIKRDGDLHAVIGFEGRDIRPDTDFKLIYTRDGKDVGVNLLTYKTGSDDGYFLLMASPGAGEKNAQAEPKDITFVLDTSGSMAGPKIKQAQKALNFCLNNLNEQDRFEIIRFSTEAEPFFNALVPANKENVEKASGFVAGLKAIGGTAIDDAMHKALSYNRGDTKGHPYVIVFLTDGEPTIGETREDPIVEHVAKASQQAGNIRVFSFGIGNEVNTHLLDRISDATKAFSQYVLAEEDIEVKVSNFYTKIKEPVLSNLDVAFSGGGIRVSKQYPAQLPDLFKGQQLLVFGRYSGTGAAAVKISGTLAGQKKEYAQDVKFTDNDAAQQFIPRLWATRRVGWLLDEIRQHGESAELKDEVVKLAREHGIVTPYTAYLIMEDESRRNVPVAMQNLREMRDDRDVRERAGRVYRSVGDEARNESRRSGDQAVANARDLSDLKNGWNEQQAQSGGQAGFKSLDKAAVAAAPSAQPTTPADPSSLGASGGINGPVGGNLAGRYDGRNQGRGAGTGQADGSNFAGKPGLRQPAEPSQTGYRYAQNYSQQARVLNGRAFYQNGQTWTDSTAQSKKKLPRKEIKFSSDEYFELLKKHPEAAAWLSLGNEVDIVLDDTLYVIR